MVGSYKVRHCPHDKSLPSVNASDDQTQKFLLILKSK